MSEADKIKNGEYVRTSKGYILENSFFEHEDIIEHLENEDRDYIHKYGKILKHDKKKIKLIEADDIVNKYYVIDLFKLNENEILICVYKDDREEKYKILKEECIEKVLTHEQFEEECNLF